MGMYTELVLKCEVRGDAPDVVKKVVRHLFSGEAAPDTLPGHVFFSCHRWEMIGSGSSAYHHPEAVNSLVKYDWSENIHIFSRSDLKDYEDEIAKFIDWITAYVDGSGETCIGWSWYEEEDKPTLIIINAGEQA